LIKSDLDISSLTEDFSETDLEDSKILRPWLKLRSELKAVLPEDELNTYLVESFQEAHSVRLQLLVLKLNFGLFRK